MKVRRSILATVAGLSLAACDNSSWAEGTFISDPYGTLEVVNNPGVATQAKFGNANVCLMRAVISVNEKTMRVMPAPGALCGMEIVLTRVNDRRATTSLHGQQVLMVKQ